MDKLYAASFATSLLVSLVLVLTKRWHGRFSMDHTAGVQKFHTKPTPRVGGVGVVVALAVLYPFLSDAVETIVGPMLLASLPALAAGLLEDVTKRVGVRERLLATMLSGVVACWLTGIALNRVDIPVVDDLLKWGPLAIMFTAFAVAGIANAVNIIDGFNGLSSGTVFIILMALAAIATHSGDAPLATSLELLAAAVLGFWAVNFPLGKLFLGDGGAYFIGFSLAWLAVLLLMRNPAISPWLVLLACAYPVIEVLYSMWRRRRDKVPAGAPDSQHLHSLVKTQVILPRLNHWNVRMRNAAVSPIIWLYAALPSGLAILLVESSVPAAIGALFACVLAYHLVYRKLAARARVSAHPVPDSDVAPLTDLSHAPAPVSPVQDEVRTP